MNHNFSILKAAVGVMFLGGAGEAKAGFVLTANAAGSESTLVAGATTETFNELRTSRYTSLTTAVGTLSSPGMSVVAHDQYGGVGGTGNYFAIGAESGQTTATLMLNGPQSYFGFEWEAADPLNSMEFLSNGKVVANFTSATALGDLSSAYYGNPDTGADASEKFAYLNFIGTAGSTFNEIIFNNTSTGTGFESDNWSVAASPVNPPYPGSLLQGGVNAVPVPPTFVLTSLGLFGTLGLARLRRLLGGTSSLRRTLSPGQ